MHFPISRLEFPTSQFLLFFLAVLAVYWGLPRHRWRMVWLLAASCVFYMSFHPLLISLILLSASVDYFVALKLEVVQSLRLRRILLTGSIAVNLGLLAFFKYTNFLFDSANSLFHLLGSDYEWPLLRLALPLGISFYTFETISYAVDVYRGKIRAVQSRLDYALYIMFFPHLAAGPIVRPRDFLPQLARTKQFRWNRAVVGLLVFLVGLFKKAIIADHLAPVVDPIFADPAGYASSAIWLGVLAYAVQIYCDFSGYSDMAMGLAHLLGFKLPVNFAMPYFAVNIADFWRRWHISLSSWLRDYLYIPLGGSRHGPWATYRNLMLTMLLGGLWHGASWTFVFWGFYHGLLLSLHRFWQMRNAASDTGNSGAFPKSNSWFRIPHFAFRICLTFLSVCIGWVFFRAQTFPAAATILGRMAWPTAGIELDYLTAWLVCTALLLVLAGHLIGTFSDVRIVWRRWPAPALGGALAGLLILVLLLFPEDSKGFIYFEF